MAAPIEWDGPEVLVSQCVFCSRYRPGDPPTCAAFKGGIPEEILTNEFDHRQPVEGDGGIRFHPTDDDADDRADDVIRRAGLAREAAEDLESGS